MWILFLIPLHGLTDESLNRWSGSETLNIQWSVVMLSTISPLYLFDMLSINHIVVLTISTKWSLILNFSPLLSSNTAILVLLIIIVIGDFAPFLSLSIWTFRTCHVCIEASWQVVADHSNMVLQMEMRSTAWRKLKYESRDLQETLEGRHIYPVLASLHNGNTMSKHSVHTVHMEKQALPDFVTFFCFLCNRCRDGALPDFDQDLKVKK